MTHRLLIAAAATACLAVATPALAQEGSPWTGFYIGGNLGGTWGDTSTATHSAPGTGTVVIPPIDVAAINAAGSSSSSKSGFTGGIEGGYNWVTEGILIGIESDWGWMDVSQTSNKQANSALLISPPITYSINQRLTTDWIWTLRPRLGFVADRWLIYGTAGLAISEVKYTMDYADTRIPAQTARVSVSDTKSGWVAGLGGAYALTPQWSLKGEWLYADFGHIRGSTSTPDGFVSLSSEGSVKANLLRMGVDYRF